jgi:hypothetical protein
MIWKTETGNQNIKRLPQQHLVNILKMTAQRPNHKWGDKDGTYWNTVVKKELARRESLVSSIFRQFKPLEQKGNTFVKSKQTLNGKLVKIIKTR